MKNQNLRPIILNTGLCLGPKKTARETEDFQEQISHFNYKNLIILVLSIFKKTTKTFYTQAPKSLQNLKRSSNVIKQTRITMV